MRIKDDRKQQNIKHAVIKLILAEGFHGASIAKIAKEAGVSPATVYVYYESKDAMLQDIYREYYEQVFNYLSNRVRRDMSGAQFIESMVRGYYSYIVEYGEAFYFVEQFSGCPALMSGCTGIEAKSKISFVFDELKKRRVIKDVDNASITAILFTPIKSIARQYHDQGANAAPLLDDLIQMIQDALLR